MPSHLHEHALGFLFGHNPIEGRSERIAVAGSCDYPAAKTANKAFIPLRPLCRGRTDGFMSTLLLPQAGDPLGVPGRERRMRGGNFRKVPVRSVTVRTLEIFEDYSRIFDMFGFPLGLENDDAGKCLRSEPF